MKKLLFLVAVTASLILMGFIVFLLAPRTQRAGEEKPQHESIEESVKLVASARENGTIKIIVRLKFDYISEKDLNEAELLRQRRQISRAQNKLILRLKKWGASDVSRFDDVPFLRARVDAKTLERLTKEEIVMSIEKDEFDPARINPKTTNEEDKSFGDLSAVINSGTMESRQGQSRGTEITLPTEQTVPEAPVQRKRVPKVPPVYKYEQVPADNAVPTAPPVSPVSVEEEDQLAPPNDLRFFRQHDMTFTEVPVNLRSTISEPTVITNGSAVFYTANWFAARSLDGGQTFSFINPFTSFPNANGGFCCDQVTAYAPNQDMFIWGLQYLHDNSVNTFRIARAIGNSGLMNNQWTYYDFTPQSFNLPPGQWFDFPSMSVSNGYLYITINRYMTAPPGNFIGSLVWRISLSQLAAGGNFSYSYIVYTDVASLRLTEGAQNTMHWVTTRFSGQTPSLRTFHWADNSTQITFHDTALNLFIPLNRDGIATSPDGTNWAGRIDSRILAAYLSNGVVGALWSAKQGGQFPYPYTIHARVNATTGGFISQTPISNPNYAWLYPAVSVNAAGNLGGVICYGGGQGGAPYPNTAVWVLDDISNNLPFGSAYTATLSTNGPGDNQWGDYLAVKPHSQFRNTWISSIFYLSGGQSNANVIPRYLWFGRERDGFGKRFDFDGDGRSDVAVFRPLNGGWYITNSSNSSLTALQFGASGDLIAPADFDGDGRSDISVFRPAVGGWYRLNSSNNAFVAMQFGANGDLPVAGDFDGDGRADISVFRPSNGAWYRLNSSNGQFVGAQFGSNGDKPQVGDFDGDGRSDLAVFRPSNGAWYILRSSDNQFYGIGFGLSGDVPTTADFDGDGRADISVFRPAVGGWYRLNSSNGQFVAQQFGAAGDIPVAADYDGDGRADVAVFRPSNGTWYLNRSTAQFTAVQFGAGGDAPAPAAFGQ